MTDLLRALLIANGEPPEATLAQRERDIAHLVLAVDGGAMTAHCLGIEADIVCGDFDSISRAQAGALFPRAEIVALPDQEVADLEKSVILALERGAQEITILGALGGRADHSLGALLILTRCGQPGSIRLLTDGETVYGIPAGLDGGELLIECGAGDTVSVFAAGGATVSISGVRWPLTRTYLPPGTRGVSNEAVGGIVRLASTDGAVLVFHRPRVAAPA
ncbi:MAG: thiamine diphosphokinase [Armatimonadetes bacterium]|nr:thiamine diphosphokinase [Armatimonadota bacterium]MDE2207212.1 thiamine diphosphokinase [Armatimonadota bacterium]